MQETECTGYGASTLALNPMGRVNRSPTQRVSVAQQKY